MQFFLTLAEKYEESCTVCQTLVDAHVDTDEAPYFYKYQGNSKSHALWPTSQGKCSVMPKNIQRQKLHFLKHCACNFSFLLLLMCRYHDVDPNGHDYWATINDLAVVYQESNRPGEKIMYTDSL